MRRTPDRNNKRAGVCDSAWFTCNDPLKLHAILHDEAFALLFANSPVPDNMEGELQRGKNFVLSIFSSFTGL